MTSEFFPRKVRGSKYPEMRDKVELSKKILKRVELAEIILLVTQP